jgi:hypothetical protein
MRLTSWWRAHLGAEADRSALDAKAFRWNHGGLPASVTVRWRTTPGHRAEVAGGARQAARSEGELAGDRLHRGNDVRDVLVELEAEQLCACIDLVPMNAGRDDGCFSFLRTDFGSSPSSPVGRRARRRE